MCRNERQTTHSGMEKEKRSAARARMTRINERKKKETCHSVVSFIKYSLEDLSCFVATVCQSLKS